MVVFSSFMTLVQTSVGDSLRGRVVSIYGLAFRGGMPLGNLAAGAAASAAGAPAVLVACGVALVVAGGRSRRGAGRTASPRCDAGEGRSSARAGSGPGAVVGRRHLERHAPPLELHVQVDPRRGPAGRAARRAPGASRTRP